MDTELPTLCCQEGIENTDDGEILVDGQPVAPGQYRLLLEDGVEAVLTVAGPPSKA